MRPGMAMWPISRLAVGWQGVPAVPVMKPSRSAAGPGVGHRRVDRDLAMGDIARSEFASRWVIGVRLVRSRILAVRPARVAVPGTATHVRLAARLKAGL